MATEKRLIDANALQFEPDPFEGGANGVLIWGRGGGKTMKTVLWSLKRMVDNAPTVDAVEVVRCKDCRYWDEDRRCNGKENGLVMEYTREDDFCSYGERKDNG